MRNIIYIFILLLVSCDDREVTFTESWEFNIDSRVSERTPEYEEDKERIFKDEKFEFELDIALNDKEIPHTEYQITWFSNKPIEIYQNYEITNTINSKSGTHKFEFIPLELGEYKVTFEAYNGKEHYATSEMIFISLQRIKIIDFLAKENRKATFWGERKSDFTMEWNITGLQEDDEIFIYYWTNDKEEIEKKVKYYTEIQWTSIENKVHKQHRYQGKVSIEIRRDKEVLIKKRKIVNEWKYSG